MKCDVLWIGSFHFMCFFKDDTNVIFIIHLNFLTRYSNFGNLNELTDRHTYRQQNLSGVDIINLENIKSDFGRALLFCYIRSTKPTDFIHN